MWRRQRQRRYYGEQPRSYRRWLLALGAMLCLAVGFWQWRVIVDWTATVQLPAQTMAAPTVRSQPPTPVPNFQPTFTPTPQPAQVAVAPLSATRCPADCEALRQQMLDLVNRDRANNGYAGLSFYDPATAAAQAHAEDMLQRSYFDHTSPEGGDPGDRLVVAQAGPASTWGENIWKYWSNSQATIDWEAMVARAEDDWMHSPGHRANILNADFTHIGIGVSFDPTNGEIYMVQVFFTPQP